MPPTRISNSRYRTVTPGSEVGLLQQQINSQRSGQCLSVCCRCYRTGRHGDTTWSRYNRGTMGGTFLARHPSSPGRGLPSKRSINSDFDIPGQVQILQRLPQLRRQSFRIAAVHAYREIHPDAEIRSRAQLWEDLRAEAIPDFGWDVARDPDRSRLNSCSGCGLSPRSGLDCNGSEDLRRLRRGRSGRHWSAGLECQTGVRRP